MLFHDIHEFNKFITYFGFKSDAVVGYMSYNSAMTVYSLINTTLTDIFFQ